MCESCELLISINFKCVAVVLIGISCVPVNKVIECGYEPILTSIVSKVVSFEVVDEDVGFFVKDVSDSTTLVETFSWGKDLVGSMGDHFSSRCSLFCPNSHVVIALDPETEKSSSLYHLIVRLLIFSISFHVVQVASQVAAAQSQDEVKHI